MTPEEVVALAILDRAGVPEPDTLEGDAFEKTVPYALLIANRIGALGWGFVTAKQNEHVWLAHKGDESKEKGLPARYAVGVPEPFSCFGCSGLFDGIGEYNP
jgi:hypothetical protein